MNAPTPFTVFDAADSPVPFGRVLRAYLTEAKYELLVALRTPSFALPFLLVPLAVYLMFGVVIVGAEHTVPEDGASIADYLFCGFAAMAVMMPGMFCGVGLAIERDGLLLRLKRALPQPPGATVVAKALMSMTVGALALTPVVVVALLAGKLSLSSSQVAIVWFVLVLGSLPFCAIGLLIGSLSSGAAAPAWGNLVFLPMLWLSGLFIPLPGWLERWVVIWPAFHLDQLALGLAGVTRFTYVPPAFAAAVLLGFTVICGGIAIRRLGRSR